MKKLSPRMAAMQLLFCILVTIALGIYAIVGTEAEEPETGTRSAWMLATTAASETFSVRGLKRGIEHGIHRAWDAQLDPAIRRRLLLTEEPRPDRTIVGTIRVVEFVGGQTYIQIAEGGVPEDPSVFYSEDFQRRSFEPAVLEATVGYTFYVLWKDRADEGPPTP